jgi:Asp-tRNA(Asn)/Glu-tRNA(Gln) amidotransferase C subunit
MKFTKKQWTSEEEQEMLASIRKRESFEKIAERHDRSVNAIKLRFGMVCRKELETTPHSIGDLSAEYRIPENHISKYMEDLENIQKKNQNATSVPQPQSFSSFDLADITIMKEEILNMNEKLDKIYKYVKKLMEIKKKTSEKKKT